MKVAVGSESIYGTQIVRYVCAVKQYYRRGRRGRETRQPQHCSRRSRRNAFPRGKDSVAPGHLQTSPLRITANSGDVDSYIILVRLQQPVQDIMYRNRNFNDVIPPITVAACTRYMTEYSTAGRGRIKCIQRSANYVLRKM